MKDVWRKYVNAGKSFKKRAQKLRDRIGKLEGSPESDDKVPMKKIYKLATGDKVDGKDLIKFDGEKFITNAEHTLDITFDAADKAWTVTNGEIGNAIVPGEKLLPNGARFTLNGSESKFNKLLPSDIDRKTKVTVHAYPGALAFIYVKSSQTSDRFKSVAGYDKFSKIENLFYAQLKIDDVMDQEAPVLTVDQMHQIVDGVIGTASGLEKLIEKYSQVERKMDRLQSNLKRAIEKEGKSGGDTAEKQAKMKESSMKVEVARIALNNAIQVDRLAQGTARNFCEGALTYIQESMRFYKD
jgi:hypothetical protein